MKKVRIDSLPKAQYGPPPKSALEFWRQARAANEADRAKKLLEDGKKLKGLPGNPFSKEEADAIAKEQEALRQMAYYKQFSERPQAVQSTLGPVEAVIGLAASAPALAATLGTELLGTGVTLGNIVNPAFAAHGVYNFANPDSDFRQALSAYNKGEGGWQDVALEGGLNALNFLGAISLPGDIKALINARAPQLYKYNPWAWKPDVNSFYHRNPDFRNIINQETGMLQSWAESPAGKAFTEQNLAPTLGINLKRGANPGMSFSKGTPLDGVYSTSKYPGPYIVEVSGETVPFRASVKGKAVSDLPGKFTGSYNVPARPIALDEAKFYKEHWLKGYTQIDTPKQLPGSGNVVKAGFPNPLAIVDRVIPRPFSPGQLLGMNDSWNYYSPLNFIPGYGKKLVDKTSGYPKFVGFRKFGNSLDDVIESQSLRPKGGNRMGAEQISEEGNWAEPGTTNEMYPGVFEATMNPQISGSNIKLEKWDKRNGIVGTTKEGDVAIPLTDPGLSFNRRLPFSSRYVPIDKQKLIEGKFQLATQLPHVQSLVEKYGLWAGVALTSGYMMGGKEQALENLKTLNKYSVDPIINWSKEQWKDFEKTINASPADIIGAGALEQKKKGGSLPKAQAGLSSMGAENRLYTYKNDADWFDNRTNYSDNSKYNDQIRHAVYSGNYGYNPVTGVLEKLPTDKRTTVSADTKRRLAEAENARAYRQSIIDAGFDPETFGKPTAEEEKTYEDRKMKDYIIKGHELAINNPVFKTAAYFTPAGMAIGAMEGAANLLPDIYNFAENPSWSGAGKVGMDALMTAPAVPKFAAHPLVSGLREVAREPRVFGPTYAKALFFKGLNSVTSPFGIPLYKLPIINNTYKNAAFKVASMHAGAGRVPSGVIKALMPGAELGPYKGYVNPALAGDENLVRQYIYGKGNMTKSDVPQVGLDKYIDTYGPLDNFVLRTNHSKPIAFSDLRNAAAEDANALSSVSKPYKRVGWKGLNPKLAHLDDIENPMDQKAALRKIIEQEGQLFTSHMFPITGLTDVNIAGNNIILRYDPITGKFTAQTQDLWKFTPSDYSSKWARGTGGIREYSIYQQAKLMDKAGKPFSLQDIREFDPEIGTSPLPRNKKGGSLPKAQDGRQNSFFNYTEDNDDLSTPWWAPQTSGVGQGSNIKNAYGNFLSPGEQYIRENIRKAPRSQQIDYAVRQLKSMDPNYSPNLETLMQMTAWMENDYGANPNAYNRDYTNSFMSLDDPAIDAIYIPRGQKTYNRSQKNILDNLKKYGYTDRNALVKALRNDDPIAAILAARATYYLSPDPLPDMTNPEAVFKYFGKNYNKYGYRKHMSDEEAYSKFLKGWEKYGKKSSTSKGKMSQGGDISIPDLRRVKIKSLPKNWKSQ